eukprot:g14357.t1
MFSGIGGLSLALSEWIKPVAFCEKDKYARQVLFDKMQVEKQNLFLDVNQITKETCRKLDVHIVYGGFPCQNLSSLKSKKSAGGRGLLKRTGNKSILVNKLVWCANQCRAPLVFLENVKGLLSKNMVLHFKKLLKILSDSGYDSCRWCIVSASSIGAPHQRKRFFLLAMNRKYMEKLHSLEDHPLPPVQYACANEWCLKDFYGIPKAVPQAEYPYWYHRLQILGNAVVPFQAKTAFAYLLFGNQLKTAINLKELCQIWKASNSYFISDAVGSLEVARFIPQNGSLDSHKVLYRLKKVTDQSTIWPLPYWPTPLRTFFPGSQHVNAFRKLCEQRHLTEKEAIVWLGGRCMKAEYVLSSNEGCERCMPDLHPKKSFFTGKQYCQLHCPSAKDLQNLVPNPEFTEWLMGYDKGWTDVFASRDVHEFPIERVYSIPKKLITNKVSINQEKKVMTRSQTRYGGHMLRGRKSRKIC